MRVSVRKGEGNYRTIIVAPRRGIRVQAVTLEGVKGPELRARLATAVEDVDRQERAAAGPSQTQAGLA